MVHSLFQLHILSWDEPVQKAIERLSILLQEKEIGEDSFL